MKTSIKGTVFAYSEDVAAGLIRCSEGRKYRFQKNEWLSDITPVSNIAVLFSSSDGLRALEIQTA